MIVISTTADDDGDDLLVGLARNVESSDRVNSLYTLVLVYACLCLNDPFKF